MFLKQILLLALLGIPRFGVAQIEVGASRNGLMSELRAHSSTIDSASRDKIFAIYVIGDTPGELEVTIQKNRVAAFIWRSGPSETPHFETTDFPALNQAQTEETLSKVLGTLEATNGNATKTTYGWHTWKAAGRSFGLGMLDEAIYYENVKASSAPPPPPARMDTVFHRHR